MTKTEGPTLGSKNLKFNMSGQFVLDLVNF